MRTKVSRFSRGEDGAVTVDWVVLCALMISLVLVAIEGMKAANSGVTDQFASTMTNWEF